MENASKALIMAGGILISILLASFMVMMLRAGGAISQEYDAQQGANEIVKFNSQFEIYDKVDNNFFDVMTVANLAYDINKKNGYDTQNSVTVNIIKQGASNSIMYSVKPVEALDRNEFLNSSGNEVYIYNEPQSALSNKSIVEYFTERKSDNSDYKFVFDCKGIVYNNTTGKVKEINFKIVQNN